MIHQHHEEYNGSGYPLGLRGFAINEMAQVLRIADEIDQLFQSQTIQDSPLKVRVAELLRRLSDQKVIEPSLLFRIRSVLL
jgi:response regulator RpfG family c-di-GMP phosphodiesterase